MQFICHPKCGTCKKAKKWLDDRQITYEWRDIQTDNPSESQLQSYFEKSGLPLKRFFNTSGMKYRELGLSKTLPDMSNADRIALLATDGMLVKRPLLIGDDFVLVGFRQKEWETQFESL